MHEELEYELNTFKEDIERGEILGHYFYEDQYEDEFSHNEIYENQEEFITRVKEYLHEKCPGKYIVINGWCVVVMTVEEAEKRGLMNWEQNIVD